MLTTSDDTVLIAGEPIHIRALAFVSVRDVLQARIARRAELQTEIDRIDTELREAAAWLAEPKTDEPAITISINPPILRPKRPHSQRRMYEKTCERCPAKFIAATDGAKLCQPCRKEAHRRNALDTTARQTAARMDAQLARQAMG